MYNAPEKLALQRPYKHLLKQLIKRIFFSQSNTIPKHISLKIHNGLINVIFNKKTYLYQKRRNHWYDHMAQHKMENQGQTNNNLREISFATKSKK